MECKTKLNAKKKRDCACVIHENVDALFSFSVLSHAQYEGSMYIWCFIEKSEHCSDLCNTWSQQCINRTRKFSLNLLSGYN